MNAIRRAQKLKNAQSEWTIVNDAIIGILSGAQSYHIGSRSVTKADLATLLKRRKELDDIIDALSGGSGRFRRVVPVTK